MLISVGLALQECFHLYRPGKKLQPHELLSFGLYKLWYLGNDQSLGVSNSLWGNPTTWIAQSKCSNLPGTAAVFKGYFMPWLL